MCISSAGVYQYIEDLMALEACISPHPQVHQGLKEITTPLRWEVWDKKLVNHPDQRFRGYITERIKRGFRVCIEQCCPEYVICPSPPRSNPRLLGDGVRSWANHRPLPPRIHTSKFGMEVDCGPLVPERGECQ